MPDGDFYVAPWGDDANDGSLDNPWATWERAFNSRSPGDVVYVRGGVYYMTVLDGHGWEAEVNGTSDNWISFLNYPGETPILDCSPVTSVTVSDENEGLTLTGSYFRVRGLEIRNVWQITPNKLPPDEADGFVIAGSHIIIENCKVHDIHGTGFKPANCDDTYLINCDAWNNYDALTHPDYLPGNDGYGFFVEDTSSTTRRVYVKNCRAWQCGDDGFTVWSTAYVEFDNCWSYNNGVMEGEGHGFKLGWQEVETMTVRRVVKNCIATWNFGHGFSTNDGDVGNFTSFMNVFNNLSYHNLHQPVFGYDSVGFIIYDVDGVSDTQEAGRVFRNNISYDDVGGQVFVQEGALLTHSNNTWDTAVSVDSSDFVNLDMTQLTASRKRDGSLPDITFGHLEAESDLIDAGVDVGFPYFGGNPDMGAFERE